MASFNMSFEEIITSDRRSKSGRLVGRFRADDAKETATSALVQPHERTRIPEGKWKNDKFAELSQPKCGTIDKPILKHKGNRNGPTNTFLSEKTWKNGNFMQRFQPRRGTAGEVVNRAEKGELSKQVNTLQHVFKDTLKLGEFSELRLPQRGDVGNFEATPAKFNDMVTIFISNVSAYIVTADLEELFAAYSPLRVAVHFNENGESLGIASVHLKKSSADQALAEYKGIALDGKILEMIVVEGCEAVGSTSIQSRRKNIFPKKAYSKDTSEKMNLTNMLDRMTVDKMPQTDSPSKRRRNRRKAAKTRTKFDAECEAFNSTVNW